MKLIVGEVANRFAQSEPCTELWLSVSYGGKKKVTMFCTTSKKLLSDWSRFLQINENCVLKTSYHSFRKIYLDLYDVDRAVHLKFGVIDERDGWVWYVSNTQISMEARPNPNTVVGEYTMSLKDVLKTMLRALILWRKGVRMTSLSPGIPLDGVYAYIYDLKEKDAYFLLRKTLPFLASLSKSKLRWLSYV